MKIFISQPMNGRTEEEILEERQNLINAIKMSHDEEIEVIDSYFENYNPTTGNIGLKYLAKSLEAMADADMVYLTDGLDKARGCKIEHDCAIAYEIPVCIWNPCCDCKAMIK